MLKSELIQQINLRNKKLHLTEVEAGVNLLLERISNCLVENKRIEIRGFGTLSTRYQKPRTAINPKNKQQVELPARYLPHFKISKLLQDLIIKNS